MEKLANSLLLKDIKLPSEPGFWPLAPGWWVLFALILLVMIFLVGFFLRRYRQRRQLSHLYAELQEINKDYSDHGSQHQLAIDLSNFLRRFVRYRLKQPQAAAYQGDKWLQFLDGRLSKPAFDQFSTVLTEGPYNPNVAFDTDELIILIEQFIGCNVHVKNRGINV